MSVNPSGFIASCLDLAQKFTSKLSLSPATSEDSDLSAQTGSEITNSPVSWSQSAIDFDAKSFHYGLPSNPISIYHTGPLCKRPTGPEAYRVQMEARPICEHPIADAWDKLGPQVLEYLDSVKIKWTSIDVTRFAEAGKEPGPVFIWVGVLKATLLRDKAEIAAVHCKKLLEEFDMTDVEIAFRESVFTRSAGPQLLDYVPSGDSTARVRGPLTAALGVQIAACDTPTCEGTGGLFIRDADKVYLLTARHVVFPPTHVANELYYRKNTSRRRYDVLHLGLGAFQAVLESIKDEREEQIGMIADCTWNLQNKEVNEAERAETEVRLRTAEKAKGTLNELYGDLTAHMWKESNRILGHVLYSPPIAIDVGPKGYSEDWALIELDSEKINWRAFQGNVIDLGMKISRRAFMKRMHPNSKSRTSFKFPTNRLLPLRDIIEEHQLRHPTLSDSNDQGCLIVVQNGRSSGATIGRTTGTMSFVREYYEDGTHQTSRELAIYPYSSGDKYAFSKPGDSGSIVADGEGRIFGLITGGTGSEFGIDVTYATPFYWLFEECIKKKFPNARLY